MTQENKLGPIEAQPLEEVKEVEPVAEPVEETKEVDLQADNAKLKEEKQTLERNLSSTQGALKAAERKGQGSDAMQRQIDGISKAVNIMATGFDGDAADTMRGNLDTLNKQQAEAALTAHERQAADLFTELVAKIPQTELLNNPEYADIREVWNAGHYGNNMALMQTAVNLASNRVPATPAPSESPKEEIKPEKPPERTFTPRAAAGAGQEQSRDPMKLQEDLITGRITREQYREFGGPVN